MLVPKKSADKPRSQPWCSHSNTIYEIQLQHSCFTWLTRMHLGTWQQSMTTIMQPFQCDLQPEIQETHRTMRTGTTTRCRTQRRNTFAHETTATATAAHTRYLSSTAEATLHGKHTRFRAPASSPKQSPCNSHAAIIRMHFAASRG